MRLHRLSSVTLVAVTVLTAGHLTAQQGGDQSRNSPRPFVTRWAREVSPARVLPEYPRPQLVRSSWTNLNGYWEYAIRDSGAGLPRDYDGRILVPFPVESHLSGVQRPVTPAQRLWYRRTFRAPRLARGERLLLHFGAVDWETTVLVNGHEVGHHLGGYDPFSFDITGALRAGGEQEVVVRVWDPTDEGPQANGKQVLHPGDVMHYTAVTGIWQTVWLEPVPGVAIRSLEIVPDIDAGVVRVHADVDGMAQREKVRVSVSTGRGVVGVATGALRDTVVVPVPNARLWSPGDPFLYDIKVSLSSGDSVRSYVGMRKVTVTKDSVGVNRIFLNGRPMFQIGFLDQGWWPDGLYRAPTDEALRWDIEQAKRLGFNMLRKHVKVEPDRWYYHADRLGVLVWQDMPGGSFSTPASRQQFAQDCASLVAALRNHPSIVMWVVFNEGWGQHNTRRYVDWFKRTDPTRLVDNGSGWNVSASKDDGSGDVIDFHYSAPPPVEPNRASVLGEFQWFDGEVSGHSWGSAQVADTVAPPNAALAEAYRGWMRQLREFKEKNGLSAVVFTQLTDVENERNGLITYDRAVIKLPAGVLGENAKLYDPPPP